MMTRLATLTAGLVVLAAMVSAQEPARRADLREQTRARLAAIAGDLDGVMGYVIVDLASGERFERSADEPFPLASTIKLTILYEMFKQADEGRLKLDEVRPLERRHVVGGSGVLVELAAPSMTLRDYATLMIMLSDNSATNLLIDTVGMANVTQRMNGLGMPSLKLRRRMIDTEAAVRGDENVGSPADVAKLLAIIDRGDGLTKASREGMLAILRKAKSSAMRDGVPSSVPVANKPGGLEGVATDAGIVYLRDRPYIFVATTTYLKTGAAGQAAIRAASQAAFDYFNRLARSSEYGRVIR
jgi:beta-lactamase class A